MFVRVKSTPNSPRKSVQIVESVRDGNTVRQRIVRHVGVATDEEALKELKILADFIKKKIENEKQPSLFSPEQFIDITTQKKDKKNLRVNLGELKEEQRSVVGIHEIYGTVYREIGFDSVFSGACNQKAAETLRHVVIARTANPFGKSSSTITFEQDFGISLKLDQVYKLIGKLDSKVCQRIQERTSKAPQQQNEKVDVLFVTVSTAQSTKNEIKKTGYSNSIPPQFSIALALTKRGLPVRYKSFLEGERIDNAFFSFLEEIKQTHAIDQVVLPHSDPVLFTENRSRLETLCESYTKEVRIKSLPREGKKKVLNALTQIECEGEEKSAICNFGPNEQLLISYNTKRAYKDASQREKTVKKLLKKLKKNNSPGELISNYEYKKFLKVDENSRVSLDEQKIKRQAQWDGLLGFMTSCAEPTLEHMLPHYQAIGEIEESFQVTKHDLKVRPILHWSPDQVKAHIAICFMTFACIRHLQYRSLLQYKKLSPESIRRALVRVQVSILKHPNGERYAIPSEGSQHARKLYQIMGKKFSTTPYSVH